MSRAVAAWESMKESENQIIVYEPNETIRLDVRLENETVWLTQAQMADLFGRDRTVITKHIRIIFSENELDEYSNVQILHITNVKEKNFMKNKFRNSIYCFK